MIFKNNLCFLKILVIETDLRIEDWQTKYCERMLRVPCGWGAVNNVGDRGSSEEGGLSRLSRSLLMWSLG